MTGSASLASGAQRAGCRLPQARVALPAPGSARNLAPALARRPLDRDQISVVVAGAHLDACGTESCTRLSKLEN